jgi:putative two-component system response regulator
MSGSRTKIILVDDNMASLSIGKNILNASYEVYPVPSAVKLFEVLENITPGLILLDIKMPDMDGYEIITRIKSNEKLADIPVIFLTSKSDEESELRGLSLGAIDYISKPFSAPLLLKRIENHLTMASQKGALKNFSDNLQEMVWAKTSQVFELQSAVLSTVAELVEFRDDLTGEHINRTQRYLKLLVDELLKKKIYQEDVLSLDLKFFLPSSQLHDVGKIAIKDTILNKPGKLTAEEFEVMKTHTTVGVKAIERIEENTREHAFLKHAKIFAGTHHEKWDGTGYPAGLSGQDIPLQGRLMAIADVYDALISSRSYKPPISTEDAARIIRDGRGKHFDPLLIDVFNNVSGEFAKVAEEYR